MKTGRDHWWHELDGRCARRLPRRAARQRASAFILYTSGTTGKPKGILHTTGGYLLGAARSRTKWVFDLKDDDTYWCTADIGWVTGHSYIVYGPLANGATIVMYEGAPDSPQQGPLLVDHREVPRQRSSTPRRPRSAPSSSGATSGPSKHDLSSLRLLGTVGEPINPEAWMWYHEVIGNERCPIVDTWWQTETGMIMISPLPGDHRRSPARRRGRFPASLPTSSTKRGKSVPQGGGGYLVITKPWPAMLRTIYGDPERYMQTYWTPLPGHLLHRRRRQRDKDGYFWISGRVDDVMNVAGHRLSTMEVESALVDHPKVAEAAVVGKAARDQGPGDLRLRHAQSGRRRQSTL